MRKSRINFIELNRMLSDGKSQRECSKVFGVTEGRISQAMRQLKTAVIRDVVMESAHKIVTKQINTLGQLQKINENANAILDGLMKSSQGDPQGLQELFLESRSKKTHGSGEESQEEKWKDPKELALKAMAEIRSQLNLQLEIFKTLYDVEAGAEFQRTTLEAIGEVDIDTKNRIVKRLTEGRALRAAIDID